MSLKGLQEIYAFSGKPKEIRMKESVYIQDNHIGNRKICVYNESELSKRLFFVNFDIFTNEDSTKTFSSSISPSLPSSSSVPAKTMEMNKRFGVCKSKIAGFIGFYVCLPKTLPDPAAENAWSVACLCMKRASMTTSPASLSSSSLVSPQSQSPAMTISASTSPYLPSRSPQSSISRENASIATNTNRPTITISPSSLLSSSNDANNETITNINSNPNNNLNIFNNNNSKIVTYENNNSRINSSNSGDECVDEWTVLYDIREISRLALGGDVRPLTSTSTSILPPEPPELPEIAEPEEDLRVKARTEWAKSVWDSITSTAYNSENPYWENFSNGLFSRFSEQLRNCGIKAHVFMKLLSKTLCDSFDGSREYVTSEKWVRFAACFWRGGCDEDNIIDWNEALSVTSASWFKGILTAVETENVFSGLPDGQFLLRYSDSMWMYGCIIFSMYRRGKTVLLI